ncbi:hypothetical protein MRQ36_26910 [Micromonospora sp. R77]|uniref:hypothetical protein n=1 Tax=Micromonospora sp. R77 TaxID=2925836 RepID=UPI001F6172EE|nr:hypothetical protein [Micromonospora sp. R77]MCI4065984.1 hypothetical protein [Micromonospora sp. R77]
MTDAIRAAWTALGGDPADAEQVDVRGPAGVLPARLPVADLAVATVAAAGLAAVELAYARGAPPVGRLPVQTAAVATAFTSERHLRLDGVAFEEFAPLSRFWRTTDGWVRTHANYPHHRHRLLTALGADPARTDDARLATELADRIGGASAAEVERLVTAADGLAVAVRAPTGGAGIRRGWRWRVSRWSTCASTPRPPPDGCPRSRRVRCCPPPACGCST